MGGAFRPQWRELPASVRFVTSVLPETVQDQCQTRRSLPTSQLLVTYRISVSHVRANERDAALPAEYVETRKTFHRSNRPGHDDRSAIVDFTNRFVWYRCRWVRA